MDLTTLLDDFLLLKIFNFVAIKDRLKLEWVCSRWHSLVWLSYTQLKRLCLSDFFTSQQYKSSDGHQLVIELLVKFGPFINELKFPTIDHRLTNIQSLTAKFEITSEILEAISDHCTKLKSLDLSYHCFPSELTFALLSILPSTLERLQLDNCRLDNLSRSNLTTSDVADTVDQLLIDIFQHLPKLKVFSLKGSIYNFLMVTERCLRHLPSTITSVDLSNGYSLKISSLSGLDQYQQLSSLHLERTSITDADILTISKMGQMRQLNLSYSKLVTNFQPLAQLSQLEYLHLNGNRENLHDSHLIAICHQCAKFNCLSIESCASLTDTGLTAISRLAELQSLSVNSCAVTDAILCLICSLCPRIQLLQLKYCRSLTLAGLQHLIMLKHLSQLGLVGLSDLDQLQTVNQLKRQEISVKLI